MSRTDEAIRIAHDLVDMGVPIFVGRPVWVDGVRDWKGGTGHSGYYLPKGWPKTVPDHGLVDAWRPGDAMCALMGVVFDLLDVDPRNGGDATRQDLQTRGVWPVSYAVASTPSGGSHDLFATIGIASRDAIGPGLDVKAGANGSGHGFAFLAPTEKLSKSTGEVGLYEWVTPPSRPQVGDTSGRKLRDLIAAIRNAPSSGGDVPVGPGTGDPIPQGSHDSVMSAFVLDLKRRGIGQREALHLARLRAADCVPRTWTEAMTVEKVTRVYRDVVVKRPIAPEGERLPASTMDAQLAEAAAGALAGSYTWTPEAGWLRWTGCKWEMCAEEGARDALRQWMGRMFDLARGVGDSEVAKKWAVMFSKKKHADTFYFLRGMLTRALADFDADREVINTPDGLLNLRTLVVESHDPSMLVTRITSGSYRPGYTHPDWEAALVAVPDDVRAWYQTKIGQGITGYPTPNGQVLFLGGTGSNGKTLVSTDSLIPALGSYAEPASPKLLDSSQHTQERAALKGQRLVVAEELTEGKALDTQAIKGISDVSFLTGRYMRGNNFSFPCSHTLIATTNYTPVVTESDDGTWRRLAMLIFPYTFRAAGVELRNDWERAGDNGIKRRLVEGADGQHDAVVTWAAEGAYMALADPHSLATPDRVLGDTATWRFSADRIQAFWEDRLVLDEGSCIATVHMLEAFNDWLVENGHNKWAKETFGPRFAGHIMTRRGDLLRKRIRDLSGLDKYRAPSDNQWESKQKDLPVQPEVWLGVRFKRESE